MMANVRRRLISVEFAVVMVCDEAVMMFELGANAKCRRCTDAYKVGNDYRLHALLKRLANAAQNMGSYAGDVLGER